MKQFVKIRGYKAWFEIFSRTLFVRWCCRTIGAGKNQRKIGKKVPVPAPLPDVLYNNSIYNYVLTWIYEQGYEVYVLHDTRLRRVGRNRFDDFRLMIDDLLNDYFDQAEKQKCKVSPMAMFSLYDYGNATKNKRRVAIIALDETKFTCVTIATLPYFDSYFGGFSR